MLLPSHAPFSYLAFMGLIQPMVQPTYTASQEAVQSQRILQVKPLIFHIFWTPDACVCVCQKVKRVKSFSRVYIGILTGAEAVLKMSMVVKVRKQLNLLVWCRRNSVHSAVSTTLWCARYATAKHGTVKCRHGSLSWPRLNGEL